MSSQVDICPWITCLLSSNSWSCLASLSCLWWVLLTHSGCRSTCTFRSLPIRVSFPFLSSLVVPLHCLCFSLLPLVSLPSSHFTLAAKTCLLSLQWILGLLLNFPIMGSWPPLAILQFCRLREHEIHWSSWVLNLVLPKSSFYKWGNKRWEGKRLFYTLR